MVRNGVAVLVQLQDFSIKAKIASLVPTRWRVAPNLPKGIEIDAATGALEGNVVCSGGVAFHRQPETSSFAITATSADGRSVTTRLVIHFVDRALRSGMGECVACSEPILERIDARAAACATVTDEAPHGAHAYCHECFNGMVRALGADGIPLECTACRDPGYLQKAAVFFAYFFADDEIMLALNDEARVRYVTLYKAKQAPEVFQTAFEKLCEFAHTSPETVSSHELRCSNVPQHHLNPASHTVITCIQQPSACPLMNDFNQKYGAAFTLDCLATKCNTKQGCEQSGDGWKCAQTGYTNCRAQKAYYFKCAPGMMAEYWKQLGEYANRKSTSEDYRMSN